MTNQAIQESGMTFGPFPEGHCLYIEKSDLYRRIQNHVQMAEFLLLKNSRKGEPVLWVVEAKSSSPRPETKPNFDEFVAEIRDKLINAFSLTLAACLGRHDTADESIPARFREVDWSGQEVKLVLVINGHRDEWLQPLKDAIEVSLRASIKTWSFGPTSVAVINDKGAKKFGLILDNGGDET
jgi:hypothetical protein